MQAVLRRYSQVDYIGVILLCTHYAYSALYRNHISDKVREIIATLCDRVHDQIATEMPVSWEGIARLVAERIDPRGSLF